MIKINDYYKALDLKVGSSIDEIQESFERKMYELEKKQQSTTNQELLKKYNREYNRIVNAHRFLVSENRKEYDELYGGIAKKNDQAEVDYVVRQIFKKVNQDEQYEQPEKAKKMFTVLNEFSDDNYSIKTEEEENLVEDIDFSKRTGRADIPSTNNNGKNIMKVDSNFDDDFGIGEPFDKIYSVTLTKKEKEVKEEEKEIKKEIKEVKKETKEVKETKKDNYFNNIMREIYRKTKDSTIIENLKIRKDDTPKSYFLRNKYILAILLASGVLAGTLTMCTKKEDDLDTVTEESISKDIEIGNGIEQLVIEEEKEIKEDNTILLKEMHTVKYGDTIAKYSEDTNSTIEEIKRINYMDNNNIKVGENIILPYYVDKYDIDLYTIKAVYDNSIAIQDYAKLYDTDLETLLLINKDKIINENGKYVALDDELYVPNFISKSEYETKKAGQRITEFQKTLVNNK